jgi:arabinofuranosyltransferase
MARGSLLVAPTVLLVFLGFQKRWTSEDAFIAYRAIRNLLSGQGPVYNLGERVEVYTSPLWFFLLSAVDAPFKLLFPKRNPLEYVAMVMGLALSGFGVGAATLAARRLWRAAGDKGLSYPIGALAIAAIPVYADFVTSGFETCLIFAWLGGSFLALVLELERQRGAKGLPPTAWVALVLGLGPLVRPDLAVPSALFLGAQIWLSRPLRWRFVLRTALAAGAVPVAYEIFRMGYFGLLISTTAIAKGALETYWEHGFVYVLDFIYAYVLWIPLTVIAVELLRTTVETIRARDLELGLIFGVPIVSGLLMALYVARVGGDYMHGRMLLPAFMTILLPFASASGARARQLSLIVLWAPIAFFFLHTPYVWPGKKEISNERLFWIGRAEREHPITLEDYGKLPDVKEELALRAKSEAAGPGQFFLSENPNELVPAAPAMAIPETVVALRGNVGMRGYAAGPRVWIEESAGGVTNVLSSHFRIFNRGRPGHEKGLPTEWYYARFSAETAYSPEVDDARAALQCGGLAELLHATEDPMTLPRFLRNLVLAPSLTSLRFSWEPPLARAQLCEGSTRLTDDPTPDPGVEAPPATGTPDDERAVMHHFEHPLRTQ